MNWPALIILVWAVMRALDTILGVNAERHTHWEGAWRIGRAIALLGLLYWGGFFS